MRRVEHVQKDSDITAVPVAEEGNTGPDQGAAAGEAGPFEYWVNVYAGFIDMGGRSREEADACDRELWQMPGEEPQPRLACRLLRYTPGKGVVDVTPKRATRVHAMSQENRAKAAERMRAYWRRKRAGEAVDPAGTR